jgi:glycosyltransferase involved in cell wall biosynthesis
MAATISVIIPSYNEEKLIGNTISQFTDEIKRRYNAEVIISDGGSTDRTIEIVEGKVDKVVKYNKNVKQNISEGRNRGFEASTGDVLIFFNADTFVEDAGAFFEKALAVIKTEGAAAIACPVKVFPSEEKLQDKIFHFAYNNYVRLLNFAVMGMGRGECHIIRREAFVKANGYNEILGAGEDFELYTKLRKIGKIKFCKKLLVYESPRRYRRYGYVKVFYDWAKNSIWITLFKKSLSKEWEAVR